MRAFKIIAVSLLGMSLSITTALASTITNNFSFTDQSSNVVASGSFSFDSGVTGILSYSDLSAFTVNLLGHSYDLAFVQSLTTGVDYIYFGYSTSTNSFVPGLAQSIFGDSTSILSGANSNQGFFFSPLASQGGPNADGTFFEAQTQETLTADAFTITAATVSSAVPEPSTWVMMILGFLGIVSMAYHRRTDKFAQSS